MTREELQRKAVNMIKTYKLVALQWCTGLGKSKAAIDMANECIQNSSYSILLVVAEAAHKNNWVEEFYNWGLLSCNVKIECYASLHKYRKTHWDLIIFDEAHHLQSDLRMDILSELSADKIILLSATLPEDMKYEIMGLYQGECASSKVTLKQAIAWGIIPKPKVYIIPLDLDNTTSNCIIEEDWGKKDKRVTYRCKFSERWVYMKNKLKYPNVNLQISCTPYQKYNYLSEKFDYWKKQFFKTRQERVKNKWLQVGSQRKRFLGELKTREVQHLLELLKDKRYICFCTSIKQAEELGRKNAIHSEKDNSLDIIRRFNSKEINSLFAVGMLQEGQNLVDIEVGVIVQLDGQERAFIQKFGRSLRATDPVQFIFYYRGTRDEEYLENVLEGIDKDYVVEIETLDEIEL